MARALYDNVPECAEELAFRKGDILTVIEQNTGGLEGWWLCSLHGRQGIVPGNRGEASDWPRAGDLLQSGPAYFWTDAPALWPTEALSNAKPPGRPSRHHLPSATFLPKSGNLPSTHWPWYPGTRCVSSPTISAERHCRG